MRSVKILFVLLMLCISVDAVVIGLSPSNLDFGQLEREQSAQRRMTVVTTDAELECVASVEGVTSDWITFEPDRFTTNKGSPKKLNVIVSVPASTPNGVYEGMIRIRAIPKSEPAGSTSMLIGAGISSRIKVEVVGREGQWFRLLHLDVSSPPVGEPVRVQAIVKNNAAIPIRPVMNLEVMTHNREKVLAKTTLSREVVDPRSRKTLTAYLPINQLNKGIYLMYIKIIAKDEVFEKYETFNIISGQTFKEDIIVNGSLEYVLVNPSNMTLGDPLTVFGDFRNTGDVPLYAKLKIEVSGEGGFIDNAQAKEVYFDVGESRRISVDYIPPDAGEYSLKIWVEYAGKRSAIYQSWINVWTFTEPLVTTQMNFYLIILPTIAMILVWAIVFYRKYYVQEN